MITLIYTAVLLTSLSPSWTEHDERYFSSMKGCTEALDRLPDSFQYKTGDGGIITFDMKKECK